MRRSDVLDAPGRTHLGAASIDLAWDTSRVVFSGDIGRYGDAVVGDSNLSTRRTISSSSRPMAIACMRPPIHQTRPRKSLRTIGRGGTVIIPVFAVGRAQSLIHLKAGRRMPNIRLPRQSDGRGRQPHLPPPSGRPPAWRAQVPRRVCGGALRP